MISKKKNDTIHFFITGGTVDSLYDGASDTVVPRKHSVIPSYIRSLKLHNEAKFTEICMKDSRHLTKQDLSKLLHSIKTCPEKKVIVTHGTYTIPDTARFLEANLPKPQKKIIAITGSMIPLESFAPSDAGFNLGYAFSQVNILSPGIYVCMNGHTLAPNEVLKFLYEGRFESIFSERN